ncbi:hypothetical protein [Candidatus Nitrosocosmicus arcticus]|uniref:hypothetical protein n=1 Tax=Candidatus Nitrosocosmicus arcticus TaxID=2035267 RepID=UPI0011A3D984|nr:hypothetical protein [Candidatus Nitrosocosmicus arcticus]
MVWRAYYLIKKDNYLKISTLLICIFSVFAVILNLEGSNCIIQINSSPLISNSSNKNGEVSNNSDFMNQQAEEEQQEKQQQQDGRQSQETLTQQSYELRKYCFLVTNLYVYSLFGVIIGFIILVLWYIRYKKIWSGKKSSPTN